MALPKTGVRLVAENEQGFVSAMKNSQGAVMGFQNGVAGVAAPLQGVSMLGLTAANVIGNVLFSALQAGGSGFINLGKQAIGVVAAQEKMISSFESMIAKELRTKDATLEMGDALEIASGKSQELIGWLDALVIKSPFEREGIVSALQLAVSYGFVTQGAKDLADAQEKGIITAQRLTEALVNWAAASGKSSYQVQMVTLALGQMSRLGKVQKQDLNQLTNAGVSWNDILVKMGYSLDDVSKGTVKADEFIQEFVKTMEDDWGSAAERQAGTLSGLLSSIGDLGQAYLREFFGPINAETGKMGGILGAVQPVLQKFVDTLTQPEVLERVKALGNMLGDFLTGAMTKAGDTSQIFAERFATPILQTIQRAFDWGANIAIQLAQGLIQGASAALIAAINFVSAMLANWFAPGSPPRVAPDLPIWGEAAMVQWLKGFENADFGALKAIQGPLQGALQALASAGEIDTEDVGSIFNDITASIAQAIAEGGDFEGVYEKIRQETGDFGVELAELARLQFEVGDATQAVTDAENALADARERQQEAGVNISKLTQEYNDLLRSGADQSTLDAKLAEINAQEAAYDLAQDQGEAAEDQLDTARENLKLLSEQLQLQSQLVQQLIDMARAAAQTTPEIPEAEAPPTGGGGGGIEPPEIPVPDTGGFEDAIRGMLDRVKQSIWDTLHDAFQPLVDSWNNALAEIQAAWNRMMSLFDSSGLASQFQSIWDNLRGIAEIGIGLIGEFIGRGLETISRLWNKHKSQVEGIWAQFWNLLASIAGGILGLIVSNVDQRLQEIRGFMETHRDQLSNIIDLLWMNIETTVDVALNTILGFTSNRLTSLQTLWDTRGQQILNAVDNLWDNISKVFFDILGNLVTFVEENLGFIKTWWEEHGANVELVVNRFLLTIGGLFDLFLLYISTAILFWTTFLADLWAQHGDKVTALVQGFLDAVSIIFTTIMDAIGASFDTWAALFTGDWEGFLQGISDFWGSIWDGIIGYVENSIETIKTVVSLFTGAIVTFFTDLYNTLIGHSIIPDMLNEIIEAFTTKFDEIKTFITDWISVFTEKWYAFWQDILNKVIARVGEIYSEITGMFSDVYAAFTETDWATVGQGIMDGVVEGIKNGAGAVIEAAKAAIQAAIDAAKEALGIQSPSKVFMEMGDYSMEGFSKGIEAQTKPTEKQVEKSALGISQAMEMMVSPPAVSQLSTSNNYNNSMEVNFNNNVNGQIDLAQLNQYILQVVNQAFDK